MPIYATQRNATRNQSTVDYVAENIFTFGNRYSTGTLVNSLGETLFAKDGYLVVRNAGTFETATVTFGAANMAAGETKIIAGLTYTSTGVTTQAQVAAAFANLQAGATTGAGSTTGTYSGALTGYTTGAAQPGGKVVFTATTVGDKTDLTTTGTGPAATVVVVAGSAGTQDGFSPATSSNLANIIGILKVADIELANAATTPANYALSGDIDAGLLILPLGVTLSTMVGSKALKDVLTDLGFVLHNVIENTKFNN